ncbi:hypothetical protein FH972_011619 [Carpinus fangiana]|uniref:SHSP domain-containing protein n=1 Tax=Carpinus fangiana TaxID=176857 RepID=A0A660KTN7_9ROSI|nr:hypothetical protein FH972_011619 [Carpinus fangiana]
MSMIPSFIGHRRNHVVDPYAHDHWDHHRDFPVRSSHPTYFPESSREVSAFVEARIDWKETLEAHVLKADLPGIWKQEVKVEVEDDRVISISGERNLEKEGKNDDTWHRCERSSGKFLRRFRLPENAKMDQVKAAMENGVLTVTVPKLKTLKHHCKVIDISG